MTALLAEFSKVSHSHDLVPLSISDRSLPVSQILSAIANGSLKLMPKNNNDPLLADARVSTTSRCRLHACPSICCFSWPSPHAG